MDFMLAQHSLPAEFFLACRRTGVVPTRFVFAVNIARQSAALFEKSLWQFAERKNPHYSLSKQYRCSTSRFGIGEIAGSNMTPRGLHRIAEKIGGGWPAGTVFKNRKVVGFTWQGYSPALITTRILWLEGLEEGFNRGGNLDSHARYIYIHGTGDETGIGRPASHGCVHLAANDLMPLYDRLPGGTLVWIAER